MATAVQTAISQMPPPQIAATIPDARWSPQIWSPGSNYDPCADLSTVLITIERATGSSPMQALMFHRGVFLGTRTAGMSAPRALDPLQACVTSGRVTTS